LDRLKYSVFKESTIMCLSGHGDVLLSRDKKFIGQSPSRSGHVDPFQTLLEEYWICLLEAAGGTWGHVQIASYVNVRVIFLRRTVGLASPSIHM
jgi:hypothetical protein